MSSGKFPLGVDFLVFWIGTRRFVRVDLPNPATLDHQASSQPEVSQRPMCCARYGSVFSLVCRGCGQLELWSRLHLAPNHACGWGSPQPMAAIAHAHDFIFWADQSIPVPSHISPCLIFFGVSYALSFKRKQPRLRCLEHCFARSQQDAFSNLHRIVRTWAQQIPQPQPCLWGQTPSRPFITMLLGQTMQVKGSVQVHTMVLIFLVTKKQRQKSHCN